MLVLGIESSCDETGVAIVNEKGDILEDILFSQIDLHQIYGGVVPEIAARSHVEIIDKLLLEIKNRSSFDFNNIDAFASTVGPGLVGGLVVGTMVAKTLAFAYNKPFIGVNHLQAHGLLPSMQTSIAFPYLLLLVSGGHSQFVVVTSYTNFKIIGTTIDDAIGEAFDKSARLMGLPYPGGKEIENLATMGNPKKFTFPVPLCNMKDKSNLYNFSFSGLKTAVRDCIQNIGINNLTLQDKQDISASLQYTLSKIVLYKTQKVLQYFELTYGKCNSFVISGGVSANKSIRTILQNLCDEHNINMVAPPLNLCTDNGVMIAWAGLKKLELNLVNGLDCKIYPRLAIDGDI